MIKPYHLCLYVVTVLETNDDFTTSCATDTVWFTFRCSEFFYFSIRLDPPYTFAEIVCIQYGPIIQYCQP